MADNVYTCLGCGEKISSDLLDCPKCGRRTKAGKQVDFDKKWNSPAAKAKQKGEAASTNFQVFLILPISLIVIIGGCVAIFQDVTKERPLTKEQLRLKSLQFCDDLIKENLKDPSSYRRINSRTEQIATGIIKYSGTNSFGGRVQESFKCFDP